MDGSLRAGTKDSQTPKADVGTDVGTDEVVPILIGAGDIASAKSTAQQDTAALLDGVVQKASGRVSVFTVGDNAYSDGLLSEYLAYYEPTWGRHKAITRPSPGNHEYHSGGEGYFDYFNGKGVSDGPAGVRSEGWYSYDLGAWHILSLNSNCEDVGGCEKDSAQVKWLKSDLKASTVLCQLAYWHHPRFSNGPHGSDEDMRDIWALLDAHGVDVVVTGHDHNYQRFALQDAEGNPKEQGIREFVVGTGGAGLYTNVSVKLPQTEVLDATSHGVAKFTLHSTRYEWEFVPIKSDLFRDSGSTACH